MAEHSVSRRRGWLKTIGVGVAAVIALSGMAPQAYADSLQDRKNSVDSQISQQKQIVASKNSAYSQANSKLADANKTLAAAQADLAAREAARDAAQAEDNRIAAELAAAEAALEEAKAKVAQGEADVAAQLKRVAAGVQTAAQQDYTLMSVGVLVSDIGTGDINNRMQWAQTVFNAGEVEWNRLEAIQRQLESDKAAAEQLQAQVEEQKAAAAQHLAETNALVAAADAARQEYAAIAGEHAVATASAKADYDAAAAEQAALEATANQIAAQIQAQIAASGGGGDRQASGGTFFRWPLNGGTITGGFGYRVAPTAGASTYHGGIDIGIGCGSPIYAAESGTVTTAAWTGGYGNYILINHGRINGTPYSTAYGHMSGYAVGAGQYVSRGQVIGYVGSTGVSTGCHLHFEVWKNGTRVNPTAYV